MRGANLRRWLNRKDCPEVILYANLSWRMPWCLGKIATRPTFFYRGVTFSRVSTNLGNDLVLFYPRDSSSAVPGSIEKIEVVTFLIRRQLPLPNHLSDPFKPFIYFPAKTYSSKTTSTLERVDPSSVISHYAQFEFSKDRAAVLNLSRVSRVSYTSGAS
ncbi:hypothetical protein B0H17DRAFT_914849 [Mycena rosella]|uniref:Uncharacterized protein n=1 Tax=Mycena rosella TaxID=1033263 RepID=A0AAD7MCP2_MYCRO|nr:hypothetical protein B0H17DRAFT_914849 [Mycena rosella]